MYPDREAARDRLSDLLSVEALRRLRAFKRDVEAALPGRVAEVRLFGSRARGDAKDDSDYDVAVMIRGHPGTFELTRVLSDASYDHVVEGYYINPIDLPDDYLGKSVGQRTELAEDILRDGLTIS